ncbi:MAG: hypothetical protein OXS29_04825 [bacterium]|nr:hypothetical protein [bacterium]
MSKRKRGSPMAATDTVATTAYDTTTIGRWAKAAIAHAEVEAISDPAGYFATVPACKGAWACGPTREAAVRELEDALADWAAVHLRTGNQPPLPAMGGISLG